MGDSQESALNRPAIALGSPRIHVLFFGPGVVTLLARQTLPPGQSRRTNSATTLAARAIVSCSTSWRGLPVSLGYAQGTSSVVLNSRRGCAMNARLTRVWIGPPPVMLMKAALLRYWGARESGPRCRRVVSRYFPSCGRCDTTPVYPSRARGESIMYGCATSATGLPLAVSNRIP